MFSIGLRAALAGVVVSGLIGCDHGPGDLRGGRPATVSAKGRLLRADGSPVTKGIITLEPLPDGGSINQATSEIGPDGSFELTSFSPKDGATPGKYRVKIENSDAKLKKGAELTTEVRAGQDLEIKLP
ncbi:hypothetical protein TA3x_005414 [Tundrisphaera sp. TA3]|uniref:hypothetical protein n=1 Tax=Tundrisphaera sp. TA3 TaxID=3435775 RepID=UPI003EC0D3BA